VVGIEGSAASPSVPAAVAHTHHGSPRVHTTALAILSLGHIVFHIDTFPATLSNIQVCWYETASRQ